MFLKFYAIMHSHKQQLVSYGCMAAGVCILRVLVLLLVASISSP